MYKNAMLKYHYYKMQKKIKNQIKYHSKILVSNPHFGEGLWPG